MPIMSRISSRAMAIQPEMLGANEEKLNATPKCGLIACIFLAASVFVQSVPVILSFLGGVLLILTFVRPEIDFLQEWAADIVVLLLVFLSLSPADIVCKAIAVESDPRENAPYQIKKTEKSETEISKSSINQAINFLKYIYTQIR